MRMRKISSVFVVRDKQGTIVDVEFRFADASDPEESFGAAEFVEGSPVREALDGITAMIEQLEEE